MRLYGSVGPQPGVSVRRGRRRVVYFELTLVRANQLFAPAQLPKNAFGSPTVSGAQYPETSVPLLALPGQIFECIDVLDHDAPLLEPDRPAIF